MRINYKFSTNLIIACLLSIFVLLIYWNGLQSGLILDDGPQIVPIIQGVNASNWIES